MFADVVAAVVAAAHLLLLLMLMIAIAGVQSAARAPHVHSVDGRRCA